MRINKSYRIYQFLFLCYAISTHAEYIVYKKGFTPITDADEYGKIYTILMNYQWPMSIGYANQMSPQEREMLFSSKSRIEWDFLRHKIKKLSPDYEIEFTPTILYELFAIAYINKIPALKNLKLLIKNNHSYSINTLDMKQLVSNPQSSQQMWYDYYTRTNLLPETRLAHQALNNAFLENLKQFDAKETSLWNIFRKNAAAFYDKLNDKLSFEHVGWEYLYPNNNASIYIINSIIKAEIDAMESNSSLLYRGERSRLLYIVGRASSPSQIQKPIELSFLAFPANPAPTFVELQELYNKKQKSLEFTPWKSGKPLGSVSFGNSLLAGYFDDEEASAASYFADRLGYVLPINKHNFIFGNTKSLFNLSLFSTLVGLFASGEFFHSRTVSYVDHIIPITDFTGLEASNILPFDKAGLLLRIGDPIQKAYELSDYIAHNAIIIKTGETFYSNTFRPPSPGQIKKFRETQTEVTQMLKAMGTIKKFAEKNKKVDLVAKNLHQLITEAVLSNSLEANSKLKQYIQASPLAMQLTEQELVAACIFNDIPKVKTLLSIGINPNIVMNNFSILMGTAALESNDALDELIKARANVNYVTSPRLMQDAFTALEIAVQFGNYNQAKKLLEAGADPNLGKFNLLKVTENLRQDFPQLSKNLEALLRRFGAND